MASHGCCRRPGARGSLNDVTKKKKRATNYECSGNEDKSATLRRWRFHVYGFDSMFDSAKWLMKVIGGEFGRNEWSWIPWVSREIHQTCSMAALPSSTWSEDARWKSEIGDDQDVNMDTNITCSESLWIWVEYTIVVVLEENVQVHGSRNKKDTMRIERVCSRTAQLQLGVLQRMLSQTRDPDEDIMTQ